MKLLKLIAAFFGLAFLPVFSRADKTLPVYPRIESSCACSFYIPNAFSPNEDGINDIFIPNFGPECAVTEYTLRIFNRWGMLLFESGSQTNGWNGIFRNEPAPQGVYMYSIQYSMEANGKAETLVQAGEVVLIR